MNDDLRAAIILVIFIAIVMFCLGGLFMGCSPRVGVRVDFTCITHKDRNDQIVSYCADTQTWEEFRAEQERKRSDARPEM